MVNEFAHNAYINKNDSLDLELHVRIIVTSNIFNRAILKVAMLIKMMVSGMNRKPEIGKRKRKSSRSDLKLTGTIWRWGTYSKKMKTKWTSLTI